MTAARARAACACGLAFSGPWELAAHFLEVFPPRAAVPLDGQRHADATRLAAKLGRMAPWEVVAWAISQRKDLRVAAAITCAARAGDLRPGDEILRTQTRGTYGVSLHVAGAAIEILQDFRIARKYGARSNLEDGDIEDTLSHYHTGTMLDQITRHVAGLEDRMSAIEGQMPALQAGPVIARAALGS